MATGAALEQEGRREANLRRLAAPLLNFLEEPKALDVVVNADGTVWVNRLGVGFTQEDLEFPVQTTRLLLAGIATVREIILDHEHPILETIFPLTGDRIEGLIPPVVAAPVMAIRTRPKQLYPIAELEAAGILTNKRDKRNEQRYHDDFVDQVRELNHAAVIRLASQYRRNLLLVGPTGSGKTTVANSIIAEWSRYTPGDRVVLVEDTPELQCALPNHVQLLATSRITQSDLLCASLRLIPKRIVVGEVRDELPARTLLSAWNTGHAGGLATLHANDAWSGLRKLEVLLGGHGVATRERIASAINVVVFIDTDDSAAGRKVREVAIVRGIDPRTEDYLVEYV